MGRAQLIAILLAGAHAAMGGVSIPRGLVVEGMPESPPELPSDLVPYLTYDRAIFQDWDPVRRDVLVTTRARATAQLYAVRIPGGARIRLTALSDPVASASFDPADRRRVVFLRDQDGDECFQLYSLDRRRDSIRALTAGSSRTTSARWAPQGGRLLYTSDSADGQMTCLRVIDLNRPDQPRRIADLPGSGWMVLDWSPSTDRALAAHAISSRECPLYLVDLNSGAWTRLDPSPEDRTFTGDGRFTKDGVHAVVATDRDSEFRHLERVNLLDGSWRRFGPDLQGDVEDLNLSPDGSRLAVVFNLDGVSVLRLLRLADGGQEPLPRLPPGVITGLKWHSNNRDLGFTLETARAPAAAYSVDTRLQTVTPWTGIGRLAFRPARAVPEEVRVAGFDGLELSGFLYRPESKGSAARQPVLILLHGGPEAQARPVYLGRWNYVVEKLGVAILCPNVRGSSGYGQRFLGLDDGIKREDAVRDVGAFLDWIGSQPGLDAARVGVYGASYGGYLALASLACHGDRLRCGIDLMGIASLPEFLKSTAPYRRDLRRGEYGDERDPAVAAFLERISPIHQVKTIRQPVLVAHGRNDPRIPVTGAEELARALLAQGNVVESIFAAQEGHGFAWKADSDFLFLEITDFLRRHLVGSAPARSFP